MKIGILALQGAFAEHEASLDKLHIPHFEIRQAEDALGFRTMNIVARRNAYGRQLGSFFAEEDFKGIGTVGMTFIRAPYIESVGDGVDVLATCDGRIVAARQGKQLVTAFHPELTEEVKIHQYFVDMISEN